MRGAALPEVGTLKRSAEVMVVVGTRPEAIKLAPVVRTLHASSSLRPIVVTSGQHRELLDAALRVFDIHSHLDLGVMRSNQSPSEVAAEVLIGLAPILAERRPAWLVVQGDTTTVAAAALAGCYARVRVAHVEAGLRSYDRSRPFPEEANRVVASHLADLHFAPTQLARDNLLREGISDDAIVVSGNPVVDALLDVTGRGWAPAETSPLAKLPNDRRWILVTTHRRESIGEAMASTCAALERLAQRRDVHIVLPVHPNPAVQATVRGHLEDVEGVTLLSPVDYLEFIWLMQRSALILTDSGGVQEEAPSLGKPVLVLRDVTERPEAAVAGTARIVGTQTERIVAETSRLLDDQGAYAEMAHVKNPFGDGHAAARIVDALAARLEDPS